MDRLVSEEWHILLLVNIHLKTDDVAILDFALREREFRLHKLDHAGFDFLKSCIDQLRLAWEKWYMTTS